MKLRKMSKTKLHNYSKVKTGQPPKYPYDNMKVGDSFFITHAVTEGSIYTGYNNWRTRRNLKNRQFTHRKVSGGYRVWRIK